MSSLIRSWRRSILVRVVAVTVLLTTVVMTLVGTLLYGQISNGILREKRLASQAEAQSQIDYTQGQLDATRYRNDLKLRNVIDQIFRVSDVTPSSTAREVILLALPTAAKKDGMYQGSSSFLDFQTIPNSLRVRVRKSMQLQTANVQISYITGASYQGIAVGRTIDIPPAATYEIYYLFPLAQQQALINTIKAQLLLTGLVLILMIGLITYFVAGRVVRPVRVAAEIAEELTAGDLARRMVVRSDDELGRLAIAFNEMALSLQQQINRLENLSRLQQRFVSDVSHELRTPLTTIRMASQVIYEARHNLDPAASRSAELLLSQIHRFEILLADLIEVSRFDAKAAILDAAEVNLVATTHQVIDQLHPSEDVPVRVHTKSENIYAQADIRRIERILRNLISNAIDHAMGKPVEVTIEETEHEVAIGVRDYGIGFNEREAERLFDRFWRADPSRSRIRGGTGLGLSIALEDAKLHQGILKAWGRTGLGAHFVLTLPKNPGIPISMEPIEVIPIDAPSPAFLEFDIDDV